MTTERMEAYCLEEGDHVYLNGEVYLVQVIEPASPSTYRFWLVDEEGFQHSIEVEDTKKIPVIIDNLAEV